jgi:peptidoglycan/LPS O-acetylase OafA/YrhL
VRGHGYRPDIDGLRAVAVLLVVGYHYFQRQVTGGFVGVDVFFVISGYLITGLIIDGLGRGTFGAWAFYGARVRRIFPALIAVLTGVLVAGWWRLLASEYEPLGRHVAAGAGFAANLAVWQESSYFDAAAATKPLLHLWSLGVEEQFYLAWPLILIVVWRSWRRVWPAAAVLGIASLALSVYLTATDPTAAFYSPLSRFWELALGGVLAGLERERGRVLVPAPTLVSLGGLVMLVASARLFTQSSAFPGMNAVWPVLGSALIIAAGPASWLNRKVLAQPALVAVGLISYPLYLWHWPILSFARIVLAEDLSAAIRFALLAVSVALAVVTYWLIERPVRARRVTLALCGALCAADLVVGLAGWQVFSADGAPGRLAATSGLVRLFDTAVVSPRAQACLELAGKSRPDGSWTCTLGESSGDVDTFVAGDSHAMVLYPVFDAIATERHARVEFAAMSQCPPLLGIESLTIDRWVAGHCRAFNDRVFAYVRDHHVHRVVLAARWAFYTDGDYTGSSTTSMEYLGTTTDVERSRAESRRAFEEGLRRTVEAYRTIGAEVILVDDEPLQVDSPRQVFRRSARKADPDAYIRSASVPRAMHERYQAYANSQLDAVAGPRVTVMNLDDVFCDASVCSLAIGDTSMYRDRDHMSVAGIMRALDRFRRALPPGRVF